MKKALSLILVLVMVAALFTACGSKASTDKLSLGFIGPLTGGAAVYGNAAKNGAELAVKEINAKGGLQVELNAQDDEHDAEKSVNAYNNLKDWGMQILIGSVTTTPCVAVSAECYKDRIFALTPSASSPAVTEGKDNVYQLCFNDPNQGKASAKYISEHFADAKVAIIYNNGDAYSTGIYETFKAEADTLNVNIVSTSTCTDDTTDFSVQVADAQNAGADVVFLPIYYTPASLILSQANAIGYAPTFFGVDGMDGILTLEGFDTSLAEGVMLLTPFAADADDEATKSFVAAYQEAYGEIPNQFAADGYDCVYAIYNAFLATGLGTDASAADICEAMIAQFSSTSFSGLTGANMTWTNGMVDKAPAAVVIKDGVYVDAG
ncbi:MAG: ABC transporter substrate-binding protein [Oscillospiraceae bacterium]|nr:ABC transporter substrate-binding protein [Oscillospiraceae bacterium]